MSQLLTREAIEQAGANITHKGNTVVPAASTLGVASGTNGCLITFDQTNGQISIGDASNNSYLQMLTASGDTAIRDSSNVNLLSFTAAGTAVNHLRMSNAATGSGPEIAALGTDSNIDIELIPKADGHVKLLNSSSGAATGLAYGAGSTGSQDYVLKGPQDPAQSNDASITLPTIATGSEPSDGDVLQVKSGGGSVNPVLEFAAPSGGGLTFNAVTSGLSQTAAASQAYYLTDTGRAGVFTLTLPSSFSAGQQCQIVDAVGLAGTSSTKITISSTQNINGGTSFDIVADYGSVTVTAVSISGVTSYVVV